LTARSGDFARSRLICRSGTARVRRETIALRKKAVADIEAMGYTTIPSETNFFMVHIRRPVQPVIGAFREKGVIVGRPFPPMLDYLRVSVGLPEEMSRFMKAFREIFPVTTSQSGNGRKG